MHSAPAEWVSEPDFSRGNFRPELIDFIQQGMSALSMGEFLRDFAPGVDSQAVQSALYVQGMRYHDSKSRRGGLPPLSSPVAAIQSVALDLRRTMYKQKVAAKMGKDPLIAC